MNFLINEIYAHHFIHLSKDEALKVLEFRNHPEVCMWMYSQNISLKSHLEFIDNLKKTPSSHYWLFKKNQSLLGVGSITRINQNHRHAYLGIYKNPEFKGVGKEILRCLEEIAFKEFALHTLHLEVIQSNLRAIGFYEKNGYVQEGRLIEFISYRQKYEDVLLYVKRSSYE